jgi:ADP-ribose pyrophosphatase YjhB (NUDIX family)
MQSQVAFCPACGDRLQHRFVPEEDRERLVCEACGHIYYLNPKIVAGTIPVIDGRVWLLRRGIEPRLGYWTFPAGFMELGETVQEAASRETLEELNLEVKLGPLLNVYSRPEMSTVHIIFLAEALSEPSKGKETLEFASFAPSDIPWTELAFWSTQRALEDWIQTLSSDFPIPTSR